MAVNDTTGGETTEQVAVEPTAEELAAMTDFREAGWSGPAANRRFEVERTFDRRVNVIQMLLLAAAEAEDSKELAALATLAVRRIIQLRADAQPYRGLNINRIDVLEETR